MIALPLPQLSLMVFSLLFAGGPDLVSMMEESFVKPMQENFQALMRKLR